MCLAANTRSAMPRGCRWRGSGNLRNVPVRRCILPAMNRHSLPVQASISMAAGTSAPGSPGKSRSSRSAGYTRRVFASLAKLEQLLAIIVAVRRPHDGVDVEFLRTVIGEEDTAMMVELKHHDRALHPVIEGAGLIMAADP